jgi:hypothetical protein
LCKSTGKAIRKKKKKGKGGQGTIGKGVGLAKQGEVRKALAMDKKGLSFWRRNKPLVYLQ